MRYSFVVYIVSFNSQIFSICKGTFIFYELRLYREGGAGGILTGHRKKKASGRENKWFVWGASEVNQAFTCCNTSNCIPEVLKIQILMRKHGTARLIFAV